MNNIYLDAYSEVYEILSYLPARYILKLPIELIELFENKRNLSYVYHLNLNKDFHKQDMLEETKAILAILYRDFGASSDVRKAILKEEMLEREEYQKVLRGKYNPDNLFKK